MCQNGAVSDRGQLPAENLGARLRQLRTAKGLGLREAAAIAGVSAVITPTQNAMGIRSAMAPG